MGWIWYIEESSKKKKILLSLLSNQCATEAVTSLAPIFRKKVTRSFAPQSSPINNENRHLIDVLRNTGQIELQFMHFQSDKKKQTQNEAHAHSAFSYFTRDRGTEKPFNRAGPGVGHDIDCSSLFIALDFYADLSFIENVFYNFLWSWLRYFTLIKEHLV